MNEPVWISHEVVLAIHEAQLAEHGGLAGIRDEALLESALARPKNLHAYSESITLTQLASAYALGVSRNQAFVDGNKRTGWVCCALFLELNGIPVLSKPVEVVRMMLDAADNKITEEEFVAWLDRDHPQSGA
jgi:death-on-curing protein